MVIPPQVHDTVLAELQQRSPRLLMNEVGGQGTVVVAPSGQGHQVDSEAVCELPARAAPISPSTTTTMGMADKPMIQAPR